MCGNWQEILWKQNVLLNGVVLLCLCKVDKGLNDELMVVYICLFCLILIKSSFVSMC